MPTTQEGHRQAWIAPILLYPRVVTPHPPWPLVALTYLIDYPFTSDSIGQCQWYLQAANRFELHHILLYPRVVTHHSHPTLPDPWLHWPTSSTIPLLVIVSANAKDTCRPPTGLNCTASCCILELMMGVTTVLVAPLSIIRQVLKEESMGSSPALFWRQILWRVEWTNQLWICYNQRFSKSKPQYTVSTYFRSDFENIWIFNELWIRFKSSIMVKAQMILRSSCIPFLWFNILCVEASTTCVFNENNASINTVHLHLLRSRSTTTTMSQILLTTPFLVFS